MRHHLYHVVQTVVQLGRLLLVQVTLRKVLLVQQVFRILGHISQQRHHWSTLNLHAQRILRLHTHQSAPLQNPHSITIGTVAIAALIHIHHSLGNSDMTRAATRDLTIETAHQLLLHGIVRLDTLHSRTHNLQRVVDRHDDLVERYRMTGHHNLQALGLPVQLLASRLVADMAQLDVRGRIVYLQRKASFVVGHGMRLRTLSRYADVAQHIARLAVLHHAAHHLLRLCCQPCQQYRYQYHQSALFHLNKFCRLCFWGKNNKKNRTDNTSARLFPLFHFFHLHSSLFTVHSSLFTRPQGRKRPCTMSCPVRSVPLSGCSR